MKKIDFCVLPDVLVVSLKRFNEFQVKLRTMVKFPIRDLDLGRFVDSPDRSKKIYELTAIVNHHGESLEVGHCEQIFIFT
jgi:hypothetical protein